MISYAWECLRHFLSAGNYAAGVLSFAAVAALLTRLVGARPARGRKGLLAASAVLGALLLFLLLGSFWTGYGYKTKHDASRVTEQLGWYAVIGFDLQREALQKPGDKYSPKLIEEWRQDVLRCLRRNKFPPHVVKDFESKRTFAEQTTYLRWLMFGRIAAFDRTKEN